MPGPGEEARVRKEGEKGEGEEEAGGGRWASWLARWLSWPLTSCLYSNCDLSTSALTLPSMQSEP